MSGELLPIPQISVNVRDATAADLPFIDGLQKKHRKQLGFLKWPALESKIAAKEILIAEDAVEPVGYCIGTDRYFKHDDVGIIYQMNIEPGRQRGFVGATLLKAMFERAAYGCKLFCCWCAQDLPANRFWEAMGFVPLAFRAGSEKRGRVHIFWQKRIRRGDTTTPWWFPCATNAGAMGADRIVLPIPPGVRWNEVERVILPALSKVEGPGSQKKFEQEVREGTEKKKMLPCSVSARGQSPIPLALSSCSKSSVKPFAVTRRGGLKFSAPAPLPMVEMRVKPERAARAKTVKVKNDPKLVAAARELRDRWLEHVNAHGAEIVPIAKYEVSRQIPQSGPAARALDVLPYRALPAAA